MSIYNVTSGYKHITVWDECIFNDIICNDVINITKQSGDIIWHQGIICMEINAYPRHASNYAMLCMEYIFNESNLTNICIEFNRDTTISNQKEILQNKNAIIGLNNEFAKAIEEFFVEYPSKKLPSGTIRIFNGAYDEIGSSYYTFKRITEFIINVFSNYNSLNDTIFIKSLIENF